MTAGALVVAAQLPQSASPVLPPETSDFAAVLVHAPEPRAANVPASTPHVEPLPEPTPPTDFETAEDRAGRFERVREQISLELERRRPEALRRCLPLGNAEPGSGQLSIQIVVDSEGREIARGVSESRELGDDVSSCLRQALTGAIRVDPPGEITDVELPFQLSAW